MMLAPLVPLSDGRSIPQLGLGVWQATPADARDAVLAAIEAGYRHVDTASIYQNEDGVGEALVDAPADVFVTTKVWNTDQGFDSTLRAFDASAARLRRDVIDLYLIHWAAPRRGLSVETWRALVRLQEEGRVRSIGVSNFTEGQLKAVIDATGVTPVLNQVELHPRFQQREQVAVNARFGVVTECWSPLGQGTLLAHPLFQELARKHGRTPAQVILRWHLDQGFVVIPKSVTPERIRQNFDVFGFTLTAEDRQAIADLDDADGRLGEHPERDH